MFNIILDTETTGFPNCDKQTAVDYKNPEHFKTCRLLQLVWIISEYNNIIKVGNYFVKPFEEFEYKESHINSVKTSEVESGLTPQTVLIALYEDLKECNLLIGHNITFDINVLKAEAYTLQMTDLITLLDNIKIFDTMLVSHTLCNFSKYPKLTELYTYFFKRHFEAHNAINDTFATFQIFCRLVYKL